MDDVRFGVNLRSALPADALAAQVRGVEDAGFDILAMPDHLGAPSPFAMLAAAAMATRTVRLRTSVLDATWWNPAMLARELATVDVLSGGRVELGVGAGHMKAEHDLAGLPWFAFPERIALLEQLIDGTAAHLDRPDHDPPPVQRPIPVMVGAMSAAGLDIAARKADVVAFAGLRQLRGRRLGEFGFVTPAETDERVAEVRRIRRAHGDRPYASEVLLQLVSVDRDPDEAAAGFAAQLDGAMSPAQVRESPFLLLAGSPEAAVQVLAERRDRYGFDVFSAHHRSQDQLTLVIAAARSAHRDG
ncbi:TIGR03621 family F420-dependent LLM class oxidoreductase [Nakamurella sp. YIM 132087]|uniref:TIGR03621 family F420-dependent LLM class oxidoreductase n=1 Tax=Nakamurella alba TaxID=2665158 RepID=A0A7K1FGR1_9ACTN|nr:TIGR03621 family F420-dependent LLM class oxidoreductase [Nakamurella alba]MTD13315.1 TIGR03621 family F420-dependent LLM class oxidoreductase [Nakamurella alba]